MLAVADALKTPLHLSTQYALGRHVVTGSTPLPTQSNLVHAVVFGLTAVVSLVPWFIGDFLEHAAVGQAPFDEKVAQFPARRSDKLGSSVLYRGFSISTFQNTSNPDFCKTSNWGGKNEAKSTHDILDEGQRRNIIFLLQDAQANSLRFSIEMSDLMKDGIFQRDAFTKYREAIEALKVADIEPIITLNHFVAPSKHFWEDEASVAQFATFAGSVAKELNNYDGLIYFTFNEPNVEAVMGNILGKFPPYHIVSPFQWATVCRNMYRAHAEAREAIFEAHKGTDNTPTVGITHQALTFLATQRFNYVARAVAYVMTYFFHDSFMQWAEKCKELIDIIGVQYYARPLIGGWIPGSTCREGEVMCESMEYPFDPEGIVPVINEIKARLPEIDVMVTEAGTPKTSHKAEYIQRVSRAIASLSNIVGVLFWTLTQNFEWDKGWSDAHSFGLLDDDAAREKVTKIFTDSASA